MKYKLGTKVKFIRMMWGSIDLHTSGTIGTIITTPDINLDTINISVGNDYVTCHKLNASYFFEPLRVIFNEPEIV